MSDLYNLLESGVKDDKAPEDYTFFLNGDLNQMATQKRVLKENGFLVEQRNVYPVLRQCDAKRALQLFWSNRIAGWWGYEKELVQHEVCTKDEFWSALNRSVDADKNA